MDEGLPSASFLLLAAVLIADIFVFGFDAAITRVKEEDVENKSRENKNKVASGLLKIMENPEKHIRAMNVFAAAVNMVLGGIVTKGIGRYIAYILDFGGAYVATRITYCLTGAVILLLTMSFGVRIPERLAVRCPEKWATACYYPVVFMRYLVTPLVAIVRVVSGTVLYLFGVRGDENLTDVTTEGIISMVSEGQEQGVLQETEADMISNIFEFSDKEAQDIMTNRNAMVAIDANMTLKEAVGFMMDTNNSRFPVYLDDIDHIIGIMHIRDAMKKLSEETEKDFPIRKIKGLLRQPKFVPETRNIDSLFHNMQSSKTQMVVVIDEYGQTAGLVSMEDILEEIVGNIMDEYDEDENYIKPTKNRDEFIVEGSTPIEVLEKKFEMSFGELEFETLNGFLISKLDRIPEEDDEFSVEVNGYSFTILSVGNHMVQSVLMKKLPREESAEGEKDSELAK